VHPVGVPGGIGGTLGMHEPKRIASLAQVRGRDDRVLSECYVVAMGFSGCSVLSEMAVDAGVSVFVDFVFLNTRGAPEGETVAARVVACTRRPGTYWIQLRFDRSLDREDGSRLADFILREQGAGPATPPPPLHAAGAGNA